MCYNPNDLFTLQNNKIYSLVKVFFRGSLYGLMLLVNVVLVHAQKDTLPKGSYCLIPDIVRQNDKSVFIPSPSITYSPETSLSLGVYAMYYFKMGMAGSCTHPSNIQFSTAYTLNKQFSAEPTWEIYSKDDNYFSTGRFLYQLFPEQFFGVGNNTKEEDAETYAHQLLRLNAKFQKRWYDRFFFGPQYQMQYMFNVEDRDPDGKLLNDKTIAGADGSFSSGLGLSTTWDSRDLVLFPQRGLYVDVGTTFFSNVFGSGHTFEQYTLEGRKYFGFKKRRVLALQAYTQHNTNNPPFRMLSLMGNNQLMRGYYQGRFRDRNYLATQAEYRTPVYKRIGMTFFAGVGQVAHNYNKMRLHLFDSTTGKGFHPSYGFGLRYLYNKKENINIRVDFGFGPNGMNGQYVTIGEAF
ncbi:MAG: BamA/TamA family outer membrane protein [Bacteroidia bacterium]